MIRLDPSALPLWRDDGRVQFGAPALARTPFAAPWVDVVVAALVAGTTRAEVRGLARVHGAADGDGDALLDAVAPAIASSRRQAPTIVQVADDLPTRVVRAVLAALPARTSVFPWAGSAGHRMPTGAQVMLLAAHRVDPRRAAALLSDDVTHIPLTLDAGSATIGPVVVPGRTACLSCLDAARYREDEQWPTIAAQLLGRTRPDVDVALAAEAGRAARFLLSAPIETTTRSLHLRADSFRRAWQMHRPDEDCQCRSPGGNGMETAPFALDLAPSSPTASALRA
ncbi:hypothetical protein FHS07_002323 [Microbacterium proteolyticum]|uniref:Bacteriocin biosynthesis cyclodehydratase domain-containing protein n=1 Tax=Microbacterium proteolyticum TaxID=1572644 RepID=A0A7W5CJ32_9MICO|nr:hypothetical protein [Microbacterium proteolyticum]